MYAPSSTIINQNRGKNKTVPPQIVLHSARARMPQPHKQLANVFSVSLISRKTVGDDEVGKITVFETQFSVEVPSDLTFQIIASPSLVSHGYMLSCGVAFVQSREPVTVQLYKFKDGPDLELPYEGLYLLPLRLDSVYLRRVDQKKKANAPFSFGDSQTANFPFSSSSQDYIQSERNTLT